LAHLFRSYFRGLQQEDRSLVADRDLVLAASAFGLLDLILKCSTAADPARRLFW